MKKRRETLTALLFLAVILGMLVLLLGHWQELRDAALWTYQTQQAEQASGPDTAAAVVDTLEKNIDALNPMRDPLIDLNGGFQRLMGKRVIEDAAPDLRVVRMDDGRLVFTVRDVETDWKAANLADLNAFCAALDTPLLYVQAPFKVDPADPQLPPGVTDYTNENADALLTALSAQGVDTLDLRAELKADGLDHASMFYRTDSHWTTEAAFWAYQTLAGTLHTDYGFPLDPAVIDRANFDKRTYPGIFLGSQGKRVGKLYGGVDDLDLITPRFDTHLRYTVPVHDLVREGDFTQSVLDFSHVDTIDLYEMSPYYVYSGGDYPNSTIENLNAPDGKKVLLVRDSFSCAVAPFLSLAVGQLDTFDLRYNTEPLTDYIARTRPDAVLIMYNAGVIKDDIMWRFGTEGQK